MTLFFAVFAALIGLVMGSFMNVLIYRVPKGRNIVYPLSVCPKCGAKIRWYSNIPVVSYIIQGGKCRDCSGKISLQYPVVEIVTSLVFVLIFFKSGVNLLTIKYCFFAFLLLVSGFTDLFTSVDKGEFPEGGVLSDVYTVGGVLAGYIWSFFTEPGFYDSLAGSGAGVFVLMIPSFIYYMVRKKEGIGLGDVFMMGMVGSFLGSRAVLYVLVASSVIGSSIGLIVVFVTKNREYRLPFAPMIAMGALCYILLY